MWLTPRELCSLNVNILKSNCFHLEKKKKGSQSLTCWAVVGAAASRPLLGGSMEEGGVDPLPPHKGAGLLVGFLTSALAIAPMQKQGPLCRAVQPGLVAKIIRSSTPTLPLPVLPSCSTQHCCNTSKG